MKKIFTKRISLLFVLPLLSMAVIANNNNDYKSTATATVTPTGAGRVYVQAPEGGTNGAWGETSTATITQQAQNAPYHTYSFQSETNAGYTFLGWSGSENGDIESSNTTYSKGVTAAGNNGSSLNLYGRWQVNNYSIVFDGNGATGGDMSEAAMSMTYNTPLPLPANTFSREYHLVYMLNGGTIEEETEQTIAYAFGGWATSANGEVTYSDGKEVNIATENDNDEVRLFAVWNSNDPVTLPAPAKEGSVLEGWFNEAGEKIGDAGQTFVITSDTAIIARWIDRYPFTMSGSNYELLVGGTQPEAFGFAYAENPVAHISPEGIIGYDAESNTITAIGAGEATIYFTQAQTATIAEGTSDTWTVTVNLIPNQLALAGNAYSRSVGDEIAPVIAMVNSNAAIQTGSSAPDIAYYDVEAEKIVIPNSNAELFADTAVVITIWQEATSQYAASAQLVIDLTVSKINNTLAVAQDAYSRFVDENIEEVLSGRNSDAELVVSSTAEGIAYYDAESNSIVVNNAAEAVFVDTVVTFSFAQSQSYKCAAADKSTAVTVKKYQPQFALSKSALELEQTAALTLTNVEDAEVTIAPEGILSYENGVVTAVGLGSATLTVTQPEKRTISGKQQEFAVEVSKKTSHIEIRLNGELQTSLSVLQAPSTLILVEATSNSDTTVLIEQLSGTDIAHYEYGLITASMNTGTAKFRATVAETATSTADTVEFSVVVAKEARHVPVTMTKELWDNANFKVRTEGTTSWDNSKGIVLGNATTGGFNWDDKFVILHFEGVPDKLTFEIAGDACGTCQTMGGLSNAEWYIQQGATATVSDEKIWTSSQTSTTFGETQIVQLDPSTRYVKLCYSGNFGGDFRNVKISELKYVQDPTPASVDFGSAVMSSGAVEKSVNVNWCNIAPLTVTSSNDRFAVTPASFGAYDQYGSQELTISFTHTDDISTQEADITLSNGNPAYDKTIHVTATTTKRPQTIVWNSELVATGFAMNVEEHYPDATISPVASTVNGERITFTSDNTGVVEIVEDTIIYAKSAGKARITAYQAGDHQYESAEDTQEFTVTLLMKQSIEWEQSLLGLLTTSDSVQLLATATSGGEIEYTSADTTVARIAGDTLIVVGEGETIITAKQAGGLINGQEWLSISQTHTVIVRDPTSECREYALNQGSLTLSSTALSVEIELNGTPTTMSFYAQHGTKARPNVWTEPTFAALMADQYAKKDNVWGWYNVFNKVVKENSQSYTAELDSTATKIRFRTTETGTTHTISNILVPRKKEMYANVKALDADVECNAIWSKTITVTHSAIDLMTVSSKQGLMTLSTATLGSGCGSYGDDDFTISFSPTVKSVEYIDTIVITDGKEIPSTVEIPVRLFSRGLNQTISGFNLPAEAITTDEIPVSATASSELEVSFATTDADIAYVADGRLVIAGEGTVTITASQEGNTKYEPAAPVEKTITIRKAVPAIDVYPTAANIIYGQPLSASVLTGGVGSVAGTFAWLTPDTVPVAGSYLFTVGFEPEQTALYTDATIEVSVIVEKANPELTAAPVAVENLVYNGEAQTLITAGEANVGELHYSLDGENWSAELPQATDAGAYAVYYMVAGDANYNDLVAEEPVSVMIDYTIAYELNGGEVETANPTHYNAETETFTLVNPTKEHYTFVGWTGSNGEEPQTTVTIATGSADHRHYVANWTLETFTITWLNADGSLIDETEVAYGALPVHADAEKAATAQYTYTFTGWTPALAEVTGAATYKAAFDSIVNTYIVIFQDEDGTELQKEQLAYGDIPEYNAETPLKEADAQYTYTFSGWDTEIATVTGAATYTATYSRTVNTYTITWLNADGSLIDETEVAYGVLPAHADAEKAATDQYTYTFTGWTPALAEVTGAATYKAAFDSVAVIIPEPEKLSQTIIWEVENLGTLEVGDYTLQLNAYTAELDVYYTSSDSTIAFVDAGNYVVTLKAGDVIITAHQDGNETYEAAEPVSKALTVVDKDIQGGDDPTALDEAEVNGKARKVLRGNQIFILRGGRIYTTTGKIAE